MKQFFKKRPFKCRDIFNHYGLERKAVVIFHGIKSTPKSMNALQDYLEACGYATFGVHVDYDHHDFETNTTLTHQRLGERLTLYDKVDFVGYSLGGLMMRAYLAHHKPDNMGRGVQIGPPNKGSKVIRFFARGALKKLIGKSGVQATRTKSDVWSTHLHDDIDYPLGVIAGDAVKNMLDSFNAMILPGADDGLVSLEETVHPHMHDHLTINDNHLGIRKNPAAAMAVVNFFECGDFDDTRAAIQSKKDNALYKQAHKWVKPSMHSAIDRVIFPWRWWRKNSRAEIEKIVKKAKQVAKKTRD